MLFTRFVLFSSDWNIHESSMRQKYFSIFFVIILFINCYSGRSIFRPEDPTVPEISTRWEGDDKNYYFKDSHLEHQAIFEKFDYDYFISRLLPFDKIKFRNNSKKYVEGKKLDQLTQELVDELYQNKKTFKNFVILKKKDFNFRTISGNLVLKYKDYPFVLKLFIETPESFTSPFSKGWQPACFFLMSGGINRYLCGFTRIKNLEVIEKRIREHPYWSKKIDFPRKWFWLPKNISWFELTCKNMGTQNTALKLPSIYGIIADSVGLKKGKNNTSNKKNSELLNSIIKDPQFSLKLSYYLKNRLDPHSDNFIVDEENKIVIVDTEHFPSMVGLTEPVFFQSYSHWYIYLSYKCFKDKFLRSKKARRDLLKNPSPIMKL